MMKMALSCGCCGPKSCCQLYCRRDKAVHVGRFSPVTAALDNNFFALHYPDGLHLPVDGMPTGAGDYTEATSHTFGAYNVHANSFNHTLFLEWGNQQTHVHTNWLEPSVENVQLPDMLLDWAGDRVAPCQSPLVGDNDRQTQRTNYGDVITPVAPITISFPDTLARKGVFRFDKRVLVSVSATFHNFFGPPPSTGTTPWKIWIYYNDLIGTSPYPILQVPHEVWSDWNSQSTWTPIVNSNATSVNPPTNITLQNPTGLNTLRPAMPPLSPTLPNRGNSGLSHSLPVYNRQVVESIDKSVSGFVQNGIAYARVGFEADMHAWIQNFYLPVISTGPFAPTGGTTYDPFTGPSDLPSSQANIPRELWTANNAGFRTLEIDLKQEYPAFANLDDTKGSYIGAQFNLNNQDDLPPVGTVEDIDLTTSDFLFPGGSSANSGTTRRRTLGQFPSPFYYGTLPVTSQPAFNAAAAPFVSRADLIVNPHRDEYRASLNSHTSDEIPRSTWKANEDFCVPMPFTTESEGQRSRPTLQEIDGIVYQNRPTFGTEVLYTDSSGVDTEFCRVSPAQLTLSIANAQYLIDIGVDRVQLDLTVTNNTPEAIPEGATVQTTPSTTANDFGPIPANGSLTQSINWSPPQSEKDSRIFNLQVQAFTNGSGSDVTDFVIDLN